MWRKSSPCAYWRWSANSIPRPFLGVRRSARLRPANSRRDTTWRYSSFLRNSSWKRSGMALSGSRGDARQELLDDRVRADFVGLTFEVQQQAMAQRRKGDRADVLDGDERLPADDRLNLASEHERLRRPRARAVPYVALHERRGVRRLRMRSKRQANGVRLDRPGNGDRSRDVPHLHQRRAIRDARHRRIGIARRPLEDLVHSLFGRILHLQLEEETIELRFRQWIRP